MQNAAFSVGCRDLSVVSQVPKRCPNVKETLVPEPPEKAQESAILKVLAKSSSILLVEPIEPSTLTLLYFSGASDPEVLIPDPCTSHDALFMLVCDV